MKYHQGKNRYISKFGISTPVLVPSFSSKGFPHVKELHNYLREKLTDASLVSTYDLHYGNIGIDQIYESDILFVDSGGYERNREHDISDLYGTLYIPNEWNDGLYEKQVSKLKPISDIVLVNFDYPEPLPLEAQIDRAKVLFEKFPDFASDFLCKPISSEDSLNNVDDIVQKVRLLAPFDIIGFTEKELGHSILERAKNIFRIRKALSDANLDKPIHIFGCLDPLTVILFFLCGADIFDGLSWLRFAFKGGLPVYMNHYSISSGLWQRNENEMKVMTYSENLTELSLLKDRLCEFVSSSRWEAIGITEHDLKQIVLILEQMEEE